MKITEENKCTACYACVNSCPKQCISMEKSAVGSIYPIIDEKICIACGICKSTCPSNEPVKKIKPVSVYAAICKDTMLHKKSTSGGVATVLARHVLQRGGVVYGAAMDGVDAKIIRVTQENELGKIQGSKYVHCHMNKMMQAMKADLENERIVMVTGTPCQIAGVRKFLRKDYRNLLLVDILCHGTPSQDCLKNGVEIETKQVVKKINFRKGKSYCLTMETEQNCKMEIPYRASYWFNGFVEGYLFRENCYKCLYASEDRIGDITLGDFWGLEDKGVTKIAHHDGVNVVLINTERGAKMWNVILGKLICEERSLDEAKRGNHSLNCPAKKPKQYSCFKDIYIKQGGKKAILYAYKKKTLFVFVRRMVRKNSNVYRIVTSIPVVGEKFRDYPS